MLLNYDAGCFLSYRYATSNRQLLLVSCKKSTTRRGKVFCAYIFKTTTNTAPPGCGGNIYVGREQFRRNPTVISTIINQSVAVLIYSTRTCLCHIYFPSVMMKGLHDSRWLLISCSAVRCYDIDGDEDEDKRSFTRNFLKYMRGKSFAIKVRVNGIRRVRSVLSLSHQKGRHVCLVQPRILELASTLTNTSQFINLYEPWTKLVQ